MTPRYRCPTWDSQPEAAIWGVVVMLLVSLVIPWANISAQRIPPFEVGELLRITAPACGIEEQIARYLRLYRDTLHVQADSELAIPVAGVTRLNVSRGVSSRSTLVGIAVGAFAGVLIGIAVAPDDGTDVAGGTPSNHTSLPIMNSGGNGGSSTMSGAAVGPVAGALIGGFLGGIVGKAFREHRWEEFPIERLRVSSAPTDDAWVVVGLSVSF